MLKTLPGMKKTLIICRPVARINFLGGAGPPKMWTFWTQKVDFLNPPYNPLTKSPFLTHSVTKSEPFGRLGWCVALPAHPPRLL